MESLLGLIKNCKTKIQYIKKDLDTTELAKKVLISSEMKNFSNKIERIMLEQVDKMDDINSDNDNHKVYMNWLYEQMNN